MRTISSVLLLYTQKVSIVETQIEGQANTLAFLLKKKYSQHFYKINMIRYELFLNFINGLDSFSYS